MKKFHMIGKRPKSIPESWVICNAPRPLMGTELWQADFVHGIFYAAIDPEGEFANANLETNEKLDAWELVYWSESDAREKIKSAYPRYADKVDSLDGHYIAEQFYHLMNRKLTG